MADRIPTYIDQETQRITELAVDDALDVGAVKATDIEVTNLTIGGDAYAPYDDTALWAEVTNKLENDTIWTGTQAEYDALTPNESTLYFITA